MNVIETQDIGYEKDILEIENGDGSKTEERKMPIVIDDINEYDDLI